MGGRLRWPWPAAACLFLLLAALPSIDAQYEQHRHGITTAYRVGGGSLSFMTLRQKGEDFCTFVSLLDAEFTDINGDGYADIVFGDSSRTAILYDPRADRFEKCLKPVD